MPRWWWQRTHSQAEKVWDCFEDLPAALGLHTGRTEMCCLFFRCNTLDSPNVIKWASGIWCWIHVYLSCFHVLLFQNGPIISRDTGRCLEVEMSKDANFGLRLVVQRCSGQKWMIRNWIKHPRHWSQRPTSETVRAVFQVPVGSQISDEGGLVVCGVSHDRLCRTLSFPQATELSNTES